jgi:hypothetical protein
MPLLSSSNQIRKSTKDKTMEIKKGFQKGVDKVKNTEVLQVADGLETFKGQERMKPYFENSYGYVVFEKVAKVREIEDIIVCSTENIYSCSDSTYVAKLGWNGSWRSVWNGQCIHEQQGRYGNAGWNIAVDAS